MSTIVSTSGRLYSDFVCRLFLQDHRETDRLFVTLGVQLAQSNSGQFHYLRSHTHSSHFQTFRLLTSSLSLEKIWILWVGKMINIFSFMWMWRRNFCFFFIRISVVFWINLLFSPFLQICVSEGLKSDHLELHWALLPLHTFSFVLSGLTQPKGINTVKDLRKLVIDVGSITSTRETFVTVSTQWKHSSSFRTSRVMEDLHDCNVARSSLHRITCDTQDLLSNFLGGIDWFDSWAFGLDYQVLW